MDIQSSPSRGGVSGASFDEGLGFKACQSWLSSTSSDSLSPYPSICLIVGTNLEKLIYILDFSGDSVDRRPNVRIPRSFRDVRFCVVDSTLYILKIRRNWKWNSEADYDDVYSFRLSDTLCDVVLDDNMLEKVPISLSPKENAVPLRCGNNSILFFSTRIRFYDKVDYPTTTQSCDFDFELYDRIHNVVRKLPQLWIRPENRSRFCQTFQLFHPYSRSWEDFLILSSHSHSKYPTPIFFTIHSYAFHHTEFIIQTDFGRLFSIDLRSPEAEWRLMDKDIKFRGCDLNFITVDGQLCFDAFGVNRFKGEKSSIEYPLSYFPSVSRSVTLLDSCTPCIVRATIDPSYYNDCYEFYTTPCWSVDVFKVDLLNLLGDGERDGDGEKKEYMKHPVSFKLCIKNQKAHSIYVVGLFPF